MNAFPPNSLVMFVLAAPMAPAVDPFVAVVVEDRAALRG
jgi:hypothetical protein